MNTLKQTSLGLIAAALLFSAPAFAATITAPAAEKPSVSESLKTKASEAVEQARDKADTAADKLEEALGKKQDKAAKAGGEVVDVQQQSVTVETPQGVGQETVTTVTPEAPKVPGAAAN